MSHSRIIIDLANSSSSLETGLKRAKVLLHKVGDEKLNAWVNSELTGYSDWKELPDYRIVSGRLMGSYLKGTMSNYVSVKNVSLPIGNAPDDIRKELLSVKFFEGVAGLRALVNPRSEKGSLCKPIPADCYGALIELIGDPYIRLVDAHIEVGFHEVDNIISCIESKLLDVLIKLEDEFGNLDDLDIDISSIEHKQLDRLVKEMHIIVFNKSVSIGDGNTIKGSDISAQKE